MSDRSLVLIDELGRGTSNTDGVGVAWTLCEDLLRKKAYTLFATHYLELTDLPAVYPNAKNVNLKVEPESKRLNYKYQLTDGPTSEKTSGYGIYIAEIAAFPAEIIADARAISTELKAKAEAKEKTSASLQNKAFYTLIQNLLSLKHTSLPLSGIQSYLRELYTKTIVPRLEAQQAQQAQAEAELREQATRAQADQAAALQGSLQSPETQDSKEQRRSEAQARTERTAIPSTSAPSPGAETPSRFAMPAFRLPAPPSLSPASTQGASPSSQQSSPTVSVLSRPRPTARPTPRHHFDGPSPFNIDVIASPVYGQRE